MARSKTPKENLADEPESDPVASEDAAKTTEEVAESTEDALSDASASSQTDEEDAPIDAGNVEETAVDTAAETSPTQRQSIFLPMVLGGLAAGGIGFAAATYIQDRPEDTFDAQAAVEAQAVQIGDIRAAVDGSEQRLGEIDGALADLQSGQTNASDMEDAVAEALASVRANLDELSVRVEAVEKRPVGSGNATDSAAIAAYQRDLNELAERVDTLEAAAEAQAAAADAQAEILQAAADASAQETLAKAAVAAIQAAIDTGQPYQAALDDLAGTGQADIPNTLTSSATSGVETLASLDDAFAPAARRALATARASGSEEEGGSRVMAFLRAQTGARSLNPREGNDPDAVLSRAQAAVKSGELTMALEEISALPDAAKLEMSEWVGLAETRIAVVEALQSLSDGLE